VDLGRFGRTASIPLPGPAPVEHLAFSRTVGSSVGTNYFVGSGSRCSCGRRVRSASRRDSSLWHLDDGPLFLSPRVQPRFRLLLGPGCESESLCGTSRPRQPLLDDLVRPAFATPSRRRRPRCGPPAPVFWRMGGGSSGSERGGTCTILDATTLAKHQPSAGSAGWLHAPTGLPCGSLVAVGRGAQNRSRLATVTWSADDDRRSVWPHLYDLATRSELAEFPGSSSVTRRMDAPAHEGRNPRSEWPPDQDHRAALGTVSRTSCFPGRCVCRNRAVRRAGWRLPGAASSHPSRKSLPTLRRTTRMTPSQPQGVSQHFQKRPTPYLV
jgi:hypothetical protein